MNAPGTPPSALLVETGLIQFGSFIENGQERPVLFSLDMLPSYPDVLRAVTEALAPAIDAVDHLLCTAEAVPLGVALSLRTGVPLVYSRGRGEEPVNDLIGAYDIGHPAILVTTVHSGGAAIDGLAANARRVGLDVQRIVTLIDLTGGRGDLPVHALIRLDEIAGELAGAGMIPAGQAHVVSEWLETRQADPK